jgi:hypothetical protein
LLIERLRAEGWVLGAEKMLAKENGRPKTAV